MRAIYTSQHNTWAHYFPHKLGQRYLAEQQANEAAQKWANEKNLPITVAYVHEGVKCSQCDENGVHKNTFDPMLK